MEPRQRVATLNNFIKKYPVSKDSLVLLDAMPSRKQMTSNNVTDDDLIGALNGKCRRQMPVEYAAEFIAFANMTETIRKAGGESLYSASTDRDAPKPGTAMLAYFIIPDQVGRKTLEPITVMQPIIKARYLHVNNLASDMVRSKNDSRLMYSLSSMVGSDSFEMDGKAYIVTEEGANAKSLNVKGLILQKWEFVPLADIVPAFASLLKNIERVARQTLEDKKMDAVDLLKFIMKA